MGRPGCRSITCRHASGWPAPHHDRATKHPRASCTESPRHAQRPGQSSVPSGNMGGEGVRTRRCEYVSSGDFPFRLILACRSTSPCRAKPRATPQARASACPVSLLWIVVTHLQTTSRTSPYVAPSDRPIVNRRTYRRIRIDNSFDVGQRDGRIILAPPLNVDAIRRLGVDAAAIRMPTSQERDLHRILGCTLVQP